MLFFITVSVLLVSANAVLYEDCGSEQATVQKVSVSGCAEDAKECVLNRNSNATFSIDFTPNQEINQVEAIVTAVTMNLPVPLLVPQPDACTDSGLTCPLPAGQLASLQITVPILQSYLPDLDLDVTWELKDENENEIVCIMFAARIQ